MSHLLWLCFLLLMIQYAYGQHSTNTAAADPAILQKADSLFVLSAYRDAIPLYEKYLMKGTPTALAYNRLGYSYQNTNNISQALDNYKKALALHPSSALQPFIYSRMAYCYAKQNDKVGSISFLEKAAGTGFTGVDQLDDTVYASMKNDTAFKRIRDQVYNYVYPCVSNPHAREFDFWIGDWDVYLFSNPSVKVGFNRIEKISEGCAILENWKSKGNHNGKSLNYVNLTDSTWEQDWVGSGGDITRFYKGVYRNNEMSFQWDSRDSANNVIPGKLTFTNLEPGKVRQHSEHSTDGGKTWQTIYDFLYVRRK